MLFPPRMACLGNSSFDDADEIGINERYALAGQLFVAADVTEAGVEAELAKAAIAATPREMPKSPMPTFRSNLGDSYSRLVNRYESRVRSKFGTTCLCVMIAVVSL